LQFDKPQIALYKLLTTLRDRQPGRKFVDTESTLRSSHSPDENGIGFLGVFTSPGVESAFRVQHFRDDLWLSGFLVTAGMFRVSLLLLADYHHFGVAQAFWQLFASRLLFLLVSALLLVALRRAACPAVADRLFLGWGLLLIATTVQSLSARPPSNNGLLLMSFGMIVVTYCLTPLPLSRQATLMLTYSAAALYVCRQRDGGTLSTVAATHGMSHLFGAVTSWRLNHRRRQVFLGVLREAQLRASLETSMAQIRTLRGLLCICAWCKRVRDEAEAWESVEKYVQTRTHASFSHGICPDCLHSQAAEIAPSRL
jgi:hypothetical protein